MIDIRPPSEEDRPAIIELARLSFNLPAQWAERVAPTIRLDQYRCAFEGGRLIATTFRHPLAQWFEGRPVPMAGIAGVATVPERRGTGVGDRLMRAALRDARESGAVISTLFPATVPFYRRLGYEYAGMFTTYEAPLTALPADTEQVDVEEVQGDDLDVLRSCYRDHCVWQNGLVESEDEDWWRLRVIRQWQEDIPTRAVVVRDEGEVQGYAALRLESPGDRFEYEIHCTHLVANSRRAMAGLLGYFRRFKGVGDALKWQGPPNEPVALLIAEQSLRASWQFRFMTRLLDVPAALESRGYPDVGGEATITVADDLFPDSAGPFLVQADAGKVSVQRVEAPGALRMSSGALASLYTGYVSPHDLVRTGELPGDYEALPFLARLFAGPPPWSMDFF
jgi:predicted acetyltransferase